MSLNDKHRLSFEFFPPKTEAGAEKLDATRAALGKLAPDFFSVTYGAGGSTRDNTKSIVLDGVVKGFSMAPHLSFGGDDKQAIKSLLDEYRSAGVNRIVALRGPSVVALVTGEERIVPPRTKYWVCTVEAMPVGIGADFLAVDEIQICADPDRGYIFTDRLLNARGQLETLFLGADSMRGRIASLIPEAQFMRRDRLSKLSYSGEKKISRIPPRSAIVAFSVDNVYAIAELIRRQKGGAAVVMGALSPRTRNAQVALYQKRC